MDADKIQYLRLVQEPISRMSTTSAIFKGFAATIVAGISTIGNDVNTCVLLLSFLPVLSFCALDIYYLKLERKFRYLYNQVIADKHKSDFSMSLKDIDDKDAKARVWDCIKSPSIWLFYPLMVAILAIVSVLRIRGAF